MQISTTEVNLTDLKVLRFTPVIVDIYWEIESGDPDLDLSLLSVDIYRSQSPNKDDLSEYELIEENYGADQYFYTDSSLEGLQHGTRVWYYKIKLKEVADPTNFIISDYIYLNAQIPNRKWLKIYNHKVLGLKKAGRLFLLLKKRSWGERDPETWDSVLMTHTGEESSANTYGTGWMNGFFKPVPFAGMTSPNPKAKDVNVWGEFYPSDIILNMLNRPPLEPGDVIVDPQKSFRYAVQRTRTVEMIGAPIEQQAQLSLIHIDDEIYDYSVEALVPVASSKDLSGDDQFVSYDDTLITYDDTEFVIY